MKVLLATHNKHKRREIQALLKGFKDVKVLNLNDLKTQMPTIVEDGKSFRQNAVKKAVTMSKFYDGLVLADDSGLEVDALYGRPGVRSARFARAKATDDENVNKLLNLMKKVPEAKRKACFVCCIALSENGVLLGTYQGDIKGEILYETRGENGFGYDPVFIPKGYDRTFAEMDAILKNKISHRAVALNKFKKAMSKIVGPEEAVQQELDLDISSVKKVILKDKPKKNKVKPKTVKVKAVDVDSKQPKKKIKKVVKKIEEKKTAVKKTPVKRTKTAKKKTLVKKVLPSKETSIAKKKTAVKPSAKKVKPSAKKSLAETKKLSKTKIKSRKK